MSEIIKLSLPADTKYITPIRLFSAGIAGRIGLDFEDIEDFRQAIAEACMIVTAGLYTESELNVEYMITDKINVNISVEGGFNDDFTEQQLDSIEISKVLLDALCVSNNFVKDERTAKITMVFDIFG